MIATAGAKLTTVVYDEGTFLRQKLFFVHGVVDLLLAFTVFNYKATGTDVTGGFVLLHALEGAAFLHDALTRGLGEARPAQCIHQVQARLIGDPPISERRIGPRRAGAPNERKRINNRRIRRAPRFPKTNLLTQLVKRRT